MAGRQLPMPIGRCAARVSIRESSFVAAFIILSVCCKDLTLGMTFLREYGAAINIPDRMVMFYKSCPGLIYCLMLQHNSFRPTGNDVVIPPRSCALVLVACDVLFHCKGVADQVTPLLFTHGILVTRDIVNVTDRCTNLLLTNFSTEQRCLPKGMAVAYFDSIADVCSCFSLLEEPAQYLVPVLDVSTALPQ